MISMAHPRECPGRKMRRATKRLYIGSYTTVVRNERNAPGRSTLKVVILSQRGVIIINAYFPSRDAKMGASASRFRASDAQGAIYTSRQKSGNSVEIPITGCESIVILRSLHGEKFHHEAV